MANKTKDDRGQYVVKSNDLIRRTRYDLTTQQQKIVLYAISKIKPNDPPNTLYEINIEDLCAACGIDINDGGGYYYKTIKDDLANLTRRLWVKMPDKSEATVSWIGDATIVPLSGKVYIKFHERMAPFLFDLRERYTQYQLKNVLVFKGRYAIRLYEILRSFTTQHAIDNGIEKEAKFTVSELRELLAVEKYSRWADFDRYVIRKAVDEINKYSDEMKITYDVYKNDGRTVSDIVFIIGSPSAIEMLNAHKEERKQLNKEARKKERKQRKDENIAGSVADKINSMSDAERLKKINEIAENRKKGKEAGAVLRAMFDKPWDGDRELTDAEGEAIKNAADVLEYFMNLGLIK